MPAVFALTVAGFLAGPRPVVETPTFAPPSIPADVEGWLDEREARLGDVEPWAAKTVVWADPQDHRRTDLVVVYLHGFSATRQETSPLSDTVAARLGANLFYARLRGHGQPGERMAEVSARDWLEDGVEAMAVAEKLGRRVVLIGTSTGATLATWMAASRRWNDQLAVLAFISPNYRIQGRGSGMLTLPWGGVLARLALGEYRSWEAANPEQERYWTTRYPSRSLLPMAALIKEVEGLDYAEIHTPLWVAYSAKDEVVVPERTLAVFEAWGADKKVLIEVAESADPANHVLAGDVLSPENTLRLAESIVEFVKEFQPAGS